MYLDAGVNNGVVLHVRHGHEAVNLGDPEPVEYVGHEALKPHVLDTCNVLSPLKVLGRRVARPLASVVDEVLGDLSQSTAFFAH